MAYPTHSSSSRKASSRWSKLYHHVAALYLTRRFEEALSALEPVINPEKFVSIEHNDTTNDISRPSAPIAQASTSSRVKIWCLYLTLVHAIIGLGPEEAKHILGIQRWRGLVAKVRDGQIWEEVVSNGYEGRKGDVDAEVVINLVTLLLGHAEDQTLTQQRLEMYLSSAPPPSLDISSSLASIAAPPSPPSTQEDTSADLTSSGARLSDTPSKALANRLKIIELYTLHVLPRNGEFELAQTFISSSDVLDDERREVFLSALQEVKEEQEQKVKEEETRGREAQERTEEGKRIEDAQGDGTISPASASGHAPKDKQPTVSDETFHHDTSSHPISNPNPSTSKPSNSLTRKPPHPLPQSPSSRFSKPLPSSSKITRKPPSTTLRSLFNMLTNIPSLFSALFSSLTKNPTVLVRTLCFLVAFLMLWGSRDVRERTRMAVRRAWGSVRGTVVMGGKVGYL